jgi:hypothetical protein
VFSLCSTSILSQTVIQVTESKRHGWEKEEQHLGKIRFANSHPKPPLQKGSLEFDAPVNGPARHVRMRNSDYAGVVLSSITELSYSTLIQKAGSTRDAPSLVLLVDINGDGQAGAEDSQIPHLSFIPRFQNLRDTTGLATRFGWYKPTKTADPGIKWQHPVRQDVWQTWNALQGGWCNWTVRGDTVDIHPPMFSLASFVAQYPNARIINDKHGGGVRLQAGGIAMADNFVGNVDAFIIGINGKTTIYDFEPGAETARTNLQVHPRGATSDSLRHGSKLQRSKRAKNR